MRQIHDVVNNQIIQLSVENDSQFAGQEQPPKFQGVFHLHKQHKHELIVKVNLFIHFYFSDVAV
jgi:hypothetical protein